MAIIVVGGSNRGVGKTALVCGLIAALPEYRWTAVKITAHDHPQPVSLGRPASAAGLAPHHPHGPHSSRASSFRYFWERKPAAIETKPGRAPSFGPIWEETTPGQETDTARYLAAGAARSLLVTAPDGDLSEPLNQLWPRFGRGTNIIFESNSVIHHVRADACLLIHGVAERTLPLPERKPSFIAAVRHADAMVAHARTDKVIPDGLCLAEPAVEQPTAAKPIFHLAALERISPDLLVWLRRKLEPSPPF
jgi:hypothetical protein